MMEESDSDERDSSSCLDEESLKLDDNVSMHKSEDLHCRRCRRSRSSGSDTPSLSRYSKKRRNDPLCLPRSVSSWTRLCTERLGIFYNERATELSDFFSLSERSYAFHYPLNEESKKLLDTMVNVTNDKMSMTGKLSWSVTEEATQWFPFLEESARCQDMLAELHAIATNKEDSDRHTVQYLRRSHYKVEEFFMQLQKLYLKRKDGKQLAKSDFTELLAGFSRIFLLNVEEVMSDRTMKIGGSTVSGVPDLCCWAQFPCPLYSVAIATVSEGKLEEVQEAQEPNNFEIGSAVGNKVLGQHAGQLLLEVGNSAFRNVALGIICMQTRIIFTYLEMNPKHLAVIEDKGEVDCRFEIDGNRSGSVYYTRPYDYMAGRDRRDIMEFLFWLGLHSLPVDYRPNQ